MSDAVLASDIRMYRREVFAFNGKFYESIDGAVFKKVLIDVLERIRVGYNFIVNHRNRVIDFCIDNLIEKDITPERNLIPFQNCLLNTNTMEILPHSPKHDILYCLNYEYDKDAKCTQWLKFLAQVLPKEGLISVLQEYLGLLFVNRDEIKLEQMLVLLGGGSNGKSVVFETIFRILGERNVSTYDISALIKGNSSDYNLAAIDGKIVNYTSELDPKDFSGEVTKKLISGEPIQARQIYSKPIMLKNIPLFICNANKLPQTDDKTHGFFRRLLIIPFDVTIADKDQDKTLSVQLRAEYSGILNWIIEGRKRIVANKIQFTKVADIDRVKEEYRIIQDSIYGFIKTNQLSCDGDMVHKYPISNSELYSNYIEYCKEVTKSPYGKNVFTGNLNQLGFKPYRDSLSRGLYVYCDRNPCLYWNKDIGNVYDDEAVEVLMEEKDEEEWKQVEVEF
jgi:P4 family phage/plasmid primase-like protien